MRRREMDSKTRATGVIAAVGASLALVAIVSVGVGLIERRIEEGVRLGVERAEASRRSAPSSSVPDPVQPDTEPAPEVVYDVERHTDEFSGVTTLQVAAWAGDDVYLVLTADTADFSACGLAVAVRQRGAPTSSAVRALYVKRDSAGAEPQRLWLVGGPEERSMEGTVYSVLRVSCVPLQAWDPSEVVTLRAMTSYGVDTVDVPPGFVQAMQEVWAGRPDMFGGDSGE